jgi:hypothetical protein
MSQATKTQTPEMKSSSQQHSAGETKNNKIDLKNTNNNVITKGLKQTSSNIYIMCKVNDIVYFRFREGGEVGSGKIVKATDKKFHIELHKNYGTAYGPTGFKSSNKSSSQTAREKIIKGPYHQNCWLLTKGEKSAPPFFTPAPSGIKRAKGSKKQSRKQLGRQPILNDWIPSHRLPDTNNLTDKDITPENFKFVNDFISLIESSIGNCKEDLFKDPKNPDEVMNCEEFLQERYENGDHSVDCLFSYREECVQKIWNHRAATLKQKAIKERKKADKARKRKEEAMAKALEEASKKYDEEISSSDDSSSSTESVEEGVSDTEVSEEPSTPPPSSPKKVIINTIGKVRKQYAKYVAKEALTKDNWKKYPKKKEMLVAIYKAKKYLKEHPGSGDVSD